ncbi:hypothetical protein KK083_15225 [Fulvivirgaceae bacterium PWU4]|uniref:Uncharacterized protein n=1 Tax=Chryseosolibacter histidini TaxID=2782349 RepID=A0AAP2GNP8_9BACT|nr:hypothetical protein [Chryseosolibacter histidini]MBT1698243.1 hypothetical protein [Chryseosolibacter histidini]
MTKITLVDIISFRESIISSRDILRTQFEPVKSSILERFEDADVRLSTTDDLNVIQRLDAFQKFLKATSEYIDLQNDFVDRIVDGISSIDNVYWNTVFNGQKLADENLFLKATLSNLQKQRDLLVDGWRAELHKWNKDRILKITAA